MKRLSIAMVLFFMSIGLWLLSSPTTTFAQEPPQTCSDCHVDVLETWQNSTHALAFSDPNFQAAWHTTNDQTDCLACHTTGFVPRTGAYDHEGVTCEACHGETPAEHPPEPMLNEPSIEICANCHVPTFNEWELSLHGTHDITCTDCHAPHPQELRAATPNDLCLNCHGEQLPTNFAHTTHAEQACVDCHWYNNIGDNPDHLMTGNLLPTGHDNRVEPQTCNDCHETDEAFAATHREIALQTPLLEAQIDIQELEAEIETVEAQGENTAMLRIIQGLLLGLVVGGVFAFGLYRFQHGS